jgi:hypothetical protein
MYPHRIRLRGPWTLKAGPCETFSVSLGETSTPELDSTTGAIQLYRRFSWPQQLQPHERLWLVLERSCVSGGALNDRALVLTAVAHDHQECDVTSLTRRSNQLTLDISAGRSHQAFPNVALEVRCLTFLRQTTWRIDQNNRRLEISGQLVGVHETPLELYVRVGEVNVFYTPAHANERCSMFQYQSEIPAASNEQTAIQIDLVSGGVIWHRVVGQLGSGLKGG